MWPAKRGIVITSPVTAAATTASATPLVNGQQDPPDEGDDSGDTFVSNYFRLSSLITVDCFVVSPREKGLHRQRIFNYFI